MVLLGCPAAADVPEHQAKMIRGAAPAKARVNPKRHRRVLIWNTARESDHAGWCIPYGTLAMKTLGEKTGAFEPVVSDDLTMMLPEKVKRFNAIVMNNSQGRWITPTDAEMEKLKAYGKDRDAVEQVLRKSILDYVARGGGIVAYHSSILANDNWPEFREMLGGAYNGHPWHEEVGIKLDDPSHPLTAAFGGKDFRLKEEIYQFKEPYSRDKVRVLISLDTQRTNMNVKWIERKDGDFPLAWVKPYGKGRVFYTAIGHCTELYWNPMILQFYLDAIQFATGDLGAPTSPRK